MSSENSAIESICRIGTRGSDLALWQAHTIQRKLKDLGVETHIEIIKTRGDRIDNIPFSELEGKNFFTKELEDAQLEGRVDLAVEHYEAALHLWPDDSQAANNLAWVLATTPETHLRDPAGAIAAGENAARLTEHTDPAVLDTLAAAYASAGRFADATRTLEHAIEISREREDEASVREFVGRLALYRSRRAYVEPAH